MKRDVLGNRAYWDKWVRFGEEAIIESKKIILKPAGDPQYRPQFIFGIVQDSYELALRRYSRGNPVSDLSIFEDVIEFWEESRKLEEEFSTAEQRHARKSWSVNLDLYIVCFWLSGLALTLNIPDTQWQRLLALMGNEGEDLLLDSVISSRQSGRKIGDKLCFPKAYQRLLDVILAPSEIRPVMLRAYLDGWYASLREAGPSTSTSSHRTPYWYRFGDENFEGGAYFGRWCIEAVAVAKAFDIDDTLCLGHPNYPGDLLQDGRCPRYPDATPEPADATQANRRSWLRLLRPVIRNNEKT